LRRWLELAEHTSPDHTSTRSHHTALNNWQSEPLLESRQSAPLLERDGPKVIELGASKGREDGDKSVLAMAANGLNELNPATSGHEDTAQHGDESDCELCDIALASNSQDAPAIHTSAIMLDVDGESNSATAAEGQESDELEADVGSVVGELAFRGGNLVLRYTGHDTER
jgi:hypothetical protein